jgi:NADPH-dependent 2,4-dienoyl-CoA reductase/sulfur reductase-like enzyme/rhodanese-related sulfurtransferase
MSKRILIVGGVAGGASAAARARRLAEDAEIILFERGPHVSFANCGLPYYIGGEITDRRKLLVQTPESLRVRFNLDVRVNSEVLSIDRSAKEVLVRDRTTGREYRERYDALVLSPGAEPIRLPFQDPRVLTLRNLEDMDGILKCAEAAKELPVLLVGAGYIGLELAEAFIHRGQDVTVVERLPQVLSVADPEMVAPLQQELIQRRVDLRLGAALESLKPSAENLAATFSDGSTLSCGMVVVAIGVRPESKLAAGCGLELGSRGGIQVDARMRTSDPFIWAVGDAVEVKDFVSEAPSLIPLAGPANRQGRIAADNILGRSSEYTGTQGTAIVKVFDLTFAMTGASEKALKRTGTAFQKIYVHPADHATYYPGAQTMSLKLLFEPKNGRILGAQAVGPAGVDKRIDVLATALRAGMTVFDLEELELSYAPPYGSAKDPVNMAGFVAANVLRGDGSLWELEALEDSTGSLLLDVRTPSEFASGTIPGAINIPVDELRERLEELPKDKELRIFCQVGLRGYVACRLLSQKGFRCRNLSGGYKLYGLWVQAGH